MAASGKTLADRLAAEPAGSSAEQFIEQLRTELDGLVALVARKEESLLKSKRIDPKGAEFLAVEVIRFARYAPASDLCVRALDVRSTAYSFVSDEAKANYPYFPFATAAAALGAPAIAGLIGCVDSAEPTTTRFQLACLALKEMLGESLALTVLAAAGQDRQTKIAEYIKMPTNRWEAALCSDFAIR